MTPEFAGSNPASPVLYATIEKCHDLLTPATLTGVAGKYSKMEGLFMNKTEVFSNYQKIVELCGNDYDLANDVVLDLISMEQEHISYGSIMLSMKNIITKKERERQYRRAQTINSAKDILGEDEVYELDDIIKAINSLSPQFRELLTKMLIDGETIDTVSREYNIPDSIVVIALKEGSGKLSRKLPYCSSIKFIDNVDLDELLRTQCTKARYTTIKDNYNQYINSGRKIDIM